MTRTHRLAAAIVGGGLAVDVTVRQIDVEQVDLVVSGGQRSIGAEQQRPVDEPVAVAERQRSGEQVDAVRLRRTRQRGNGTAVAIGGA